MTSFILLLRTLSKNADLQKLSEVSINPHFPEEIRLLAKMRLLLLEKKIPELHELYNFNLSGVKPIEIYADLELLNALTLSIFDESAIEQWKKALDLNLQIPDESTCFICNFHLTVCYIAQNKIVDAQTTISNLVNNFEFPEEFAGLLKPSAEVTWNQTSGDLILPPDKKIKVRTEELQGKILTSLISDENTDKHSLIKKLQWNFDKVMQTENRLHAAIYRFNKKTDNLIAYNGKKYVLRRRVKVI